MMLTFTPFQLTAQFLAEMVMPRSRSRLHAVHDTVIDLLVASENPALAEECVHERGLAVVNVSNDGDITKLFVTNEIFKKVSSWRLAGRDRKGRPEKGARQQ